MRYLHPVLLNFSSLVKKKVKFTKEVLSCSNFLYKNIIENLKKLRLFKIFNINKFS